MKIINLIQLGLRSEPSRVMLREKKVQNQRLYYYSPFGITRIFGILCPFSHYYSSPFRAYPRFLTYSAAGQIFPLQHVCCTDIAWSGAVLFLEKRRNGRGINSLYYRTEREREEACAHTHIYTGNEMDVGTRAHLSEVNAHARREHYFVRGIYIYICIRFPWLCCVMRNKKLPTPFFQIISHIASVLRWLVRRPGGNVCQFSQLSPCFMDHKGRIPRYFE